MNAGRHNGAHGFDTRGRRTSMVEIGFDRPLAPADALAADKLGRLGYAQSAVAALSSVSTTSGLVLSVEGAWGSGKTSTLAMIEALLAAQSPKPVIVRFNPWLIGERDALLRHFLSRISAAVSLADGASDGKRVARELKSYSKVFDFMKLVPGAEPWASLVKSVLEAAGESVDSVSGLKAPDVEARKAKVEEALRRFSRPVVVFIDDVDRLYPAEVFEMVRIVKAVGDLPNVGYVLAWDPDYVGAALASAGVPRAESYLDKVVQLRLPVPAIAAHARGLLINEALSRLDAEADRQFFPNAEDRLATLYFSGLRELLDQPRDYARVFNTVAAIEPILRGEVVLADIIGFAAIVVKAPAVFEVMREEPRWFVGHLPGDSGFRDAAEILAEGAERLLAAYAQCTRPAAARALVHRLFPMTASARSKGFVERIIDVEGHIAAPHRLMVALQLHLSVADVSLVSARRYLQHPDQRSAIAESLTERNCLEFLEALGDLAAATAIAGVSDVEKLCVDIARIADTKPFVMRSQDRSGFFRLPAENVAIRAIAMATKSLDAGRAAIAQRIVEDPSSLTVAVELFGLSFLNSRDEDGENEVKCAAGSEDQLRKVLTQNVMAAAKSGRLLDTCNPGYVLWRMSQIDSAMCPAVFAALKKSDATLDRFALAILSHSYDSYKGQQYALPEDTSKVTAYVALSDFKNHARKRLAHPTLGLPATAAWRAVVEGRAIYGVDGSYAK